MRVFEIGFQFATTSSNENNFSQRNVSVLDHIFTQSHKYLEFLKVYIRLQGCNISFINSFLQCNATVIGGKRINFTTADLVSPSHNNCSFFLLFFFFFFFWGGGGYFCEFVIPREMPEGNAYKHFFKHVHKAMVLLHIYYIFWVFHYQVTMETKLIS